MPHEQLQALQDKGHIHNVRPTDTNAARTQLLERIENEFTYHAPTPEQQVSYAQLRLHAKEFATLIANLTPACHEQRLALDLLNLAIMQANAAIARHPEE